MLQNRTGAQVQKQNLESIRVDQIKFAQRAPPLESSSRIAKLVLDASDRPLYQTFHLNFTSFQSPKHTLRNEQARERGITINTEKQRGRQRKRATRTHASQASHSRAIAATDTSLHQSS